MKIVSWNMGVAFGPYSEQHDRAWHWLAALDPELALLQECVPPAWAAERWNVLTLPFVHWASALLAKRELGLTPVEQDPTSLLGRFGSYLATGEVPRNGLPPLLVASVHTRAAVVPEWVTAGHDRDAMARPSVRIPWSNDAAFAGYRDLASGRAFLIGGDWNTARYVDEHGVPADGGLEFFDRASDAGWNEISLDTEAHERRTWYGPGGPRPYQPDHLFADAMTATGAGPSRIDAYPVEALGLSDHAPIVVDVELTGVSPATKAHPVEAPTGGASHG